MTDSQMLARIDRLEARLDALIALQVSALEGGDKQKRRSTEEVLRAVGLTQVEIARLVGKTQSAVSQALARRRA